MKYLSTAAGIQAIGGLVVLALILAGDVRGAAGQTRIEQSNRGGELSDQVVRAIDDPHLGDRWLLMRNDAQPGGPGRLIRVPAQEKQDGGGTTDVPAATAIPTAKRAQIAEPGVKLPVIHAGDRLVIEESTAISEVRLEAVAMGPATAGTRFAVRLKIGGGVVPAIAMGPGRAAFAPLATRTGAQP